MAKPIAIDFTSDTKQVIRETDNLADAFDGVSDSLKDLARDSDKATDKVTDGSKDAAKSAARLETALADSGDGATKLASSVDRAFDSISADARAAGKNVAKSQKDGFREASEGAQNFKEEANSTAKESAASFDGSAESIAGSFQEIAANAFAGFGPAGAAAGLAAAVGLGIALGKLQELAEVNTETKTKVAELGREIYDTGGKLDDADLAAKISDIAFSLAKEDVWFQWGDQAITYIGLVKESLEGVGDVDAKGIFKALAGDVEAAAKAQDQLQKSIQADDDALKDHILTVDEYGNVVLDKEGSAIKSSIESRKDLQKKIEDATGVQKDASSEVDYYTQVMGESTTATERNKDATEAAKDAVQDLADARDRAAGAAMDAEEAELKWRDTLGEMTKDIRTNGKTMDINTEAGRANRQSLLDIAAAANDVVDSQVAQGGSTADVTAKAQALRDAFIEQARAAGLPKDAAEALATSYGLIPANVATKVEAHGTEEAKAAVESIPEAKDTDVNVTETGAAAAGEAVAKAAEPKEATVTVKEAGAADVQRTIENIKGRDIPITLSIANAAGFAAELARLTSPKTQYVDLVPREGVPVP